MWSYYGGKGNLINSYPKPKYNKIIEPFAGSAKYSLKHFDNDVILVDKYPIIPRIWKFLQQCSPKDILSLPAIKAGQKIDETMFETIEMFWLMGFLICGGGFMPNRTVTPWGETKYKGNLKRISASLFKIKHWLIREGDYTSIQNQTATWFIDPPYFIGGHKYKANNKTLNYYELSKWCQQRTGLTIVCENTKASWLPFKPIKEQRGIRYTTTEAIWCNEKTAYDFQQQKIHFLPPSIPTVEVSDTTKAQ